MLKTEVFVSCNSALSTLLPSSGMWFSLDSSGNPASWMLSQSLPTSLSYPLHFLISFFFFLYFLHNILSLCKWWNFCTVTGLSSPVGWQSSDAATSSSSHIVFVSPRLLLSNLKMSMPAVSISQSHLWKAWVHIYKWHFMYDGKGLQWKKIGKKI